jgi:hypothetical protein
MEVRLNARAEDVRNPAEKEGAGRVFLLWTLLLSPWVFVPPLLAMVFDTRPALSISGFARSRLTLSRWGLSGYLEEGAAIVLFPSVNLIAFIIASYAGS